MIDSCHESQTEISDHQRETYRIFLEQWPALQETVVKEIIRYCNEEERFAYGPDEPEGIRRVVARDRDGGGDG